MSPAENRKLNFRIYELLGLRWGAAEPGADKAIEIERKRAIATGTGIDLGNIRRILFRGPEWI